MLELLSLGVEEVKRSSPSLRSVENAQLLLSILIKAKPVLQSEACDSLLSGFTMTTQNLMCDLQSNELHQAISTYMAGGELDEFKRVWQQCEQVTEALVKPLNTLIDFMLETILGCATSESPCSRELLSTCAEVNEASAKTQGALH